MGISSTTLRRAFAGESVRSCGLFEPLPICPRKISPGDAFRLLSDNDILGTLLFSIPNTTDRKPSENASRSTHCDIVCSGDHDFSDRGDATALRGRADLDGLPRPDTAAGAEHPRALYPATAGASPAGAKSAEPIN